ncbi:MAG: response regulator transcription factor [Chloroflexi bacterium]|nr:response regulator transcription factor [Chloroflexota bacterium]MCI0575679.1 response regulator transcription factor [Chloroflexota bacterium]MCI0647810.1 response regulator transcription factor [Chloroflexota bacterium]MCI0725174.1 response regulator transcription factor [Chloroflexota bacterium]
MKRRIILIIDDNITNLKVAVDYLQAYGFEIIVARNGATGIERARFARPDLILLDVQMAGLDGFETCRRLKANLETAAIPIIFMTALSDPLDRVKGLEAGAVDYVVKPIEEAEILARVKTHLALRELQAQLQQQNEQLEERVRERTAALEAEIAQRKRSQEEKEHLFDLVHQQSEQLRDLTNLFVENQQQHNQDLAQVVNEEIGRELTLLALRLEQVRQILVKQVGLSQALNEVNAALDILQGVRQQTQQVTSELTQLPSNNQSLLANPLLNLSTREVEVLQLLVQGRSNAEIATLLVLSKSTVSTYRQRIMDKLDIHDLPALVKFAIQHNLV